MQLRTEFGDTQHRQSNTTQHIPRQKYWPYQVGLEPTTFCPLDTLWIHLYFSLQSYTEAAQLAEFKITHTCTCTCTVRACTNNAHLNPYASPGTLHVHVHVYTVHSIRTIAAKLIPVYSTAFYAEQYAKVDRGPLGIQTIAVGTSVVARNIQEI